MIFVVGRVIVDAVAHRQRGAQPLRSARGPVFLEARDECRAEDRASPSLPGRSNPRRGPARGGAGDRGRARGPAGAPRRTDRADDHLRPARRRRAPGGRRPGGARLRQGRRVRDLPAERARVRGRLLRGVHRRRRLDHHQPALYRRRAGQPAQRLARPLPADRASVAGACPRGGGALRGRGDLRARRGRGRDPVRGTAGRRWRAAGRRHRPRQRRGHAAVLQRHHRTAQGRDADPPQPGRQPLPDRPAPGPGPRRPHHRRAAALSHLPADGAAVRKGATLVTMPRFDLEEFLRLIQDHRVTQAFLVPPIILALAKHPLVDKYDLSSLKTVLSGAAPLDAALEAAAAERIGTLVTQGWGLTETSPVATTNLGGEPRPGSVGRLLPNTEMRVVDPASGADRPVGETGELVVSGPQVMKGYLGRPEETAAMLDPDGWLHTGDLGYVDGDGYWYVVDRVKELIKYKGLQVAPAELEAVLLSHPAIADAAVVRAADEEAGEVPKAFVVARSPLTEAEVMAYVAERVAPFKKVRIVEFVDEIPKAPSGKILRRVLANR